MRLPIEGYEGLYEVSSKGHVYSVVQTNSRRKRKLKPMVNTGGYLRVNLYNDKGESTKYYVHRLVAAAFHGQPDENEVVNHIDANKSNNAVENLQWCTQAENIEHSFENGLQPRSIMTSVNGKLYNTMKEASLAIGLKHFRIAHERRKKGNEFEMNGYVIKCGDAVHV